LLCVGAAAALVAVTITARRKNQRTV
jgi:hypothetical protein